MNHECKTRAATVVHTVSRWQQQDSASSPLPDCGKLQQELLNAISDCRQEPLAVRRIQALLAETLAPASLLYFDRDEAGLLRAIEEGDLFERLPLGADASLKRWASASCESGSVTINQLPGAHAWTVVMAPVLLKGRSPEVVCAVFRHGSIAGASVAGALQLGASHVTLWHILQAANRATGESRNSAALLELLARLDGSNDLTGACYALVNDVRDFLGSHLVAVGLTRDDRVDCRLAAVSGLSDFDNRTDFHQAVESVLNESALRQRVTILPSQAGGESEGTLAHQSLLAMVDATSVVSSPLVDENDEVVGAWLLLGESEFGDSCEAVRFVRASRTVLGTKLSTLQRNHSNPLLRPLRRLLAKCRARKVVIGSCLLATLVIAMLIPINYRIGCDCQLEPVSRRFVAAPYDGTLEKVAVDPGEVVTRGQVLARMDARELRWELSGLNADYASERKKRDAAAARDEVAEAQQSGLEMERLKLRMQLLEHRLENLEIKSPFDGIVITGDLRKTEGTPMTIGQAMFEIGPLDQMIVEVAIPEREILHVRGGMQVEIRLSAAAGTVVTGTLGQVFPRSEMRESESVYIAEVQLDNRDGTLRPGMKGTAKVIGDPHPLGWNLFHRAWESLAMKIGY